MHGHPSELKFKAVADYLAGDPIQTILHRYRIGKTTLWRWTRDFHGEQQVEHERARRMRGLDNPKKSDGWKPPGAWR